MRKRFLALLLLVCMLPLAALADQTVGQTDGYAAQTEELPVQTEEIPVQTEEIPVQTEEYPVQTDVFAAPVYSRIEIGANNATIKNIQRRLIELNYLKYGSDDGTYWTQTNRAIMAFQQRNYLVVTDRVIDEATQAALFSEDARPASETVLRVAQRGEAVRLMQQRLFEWGFSFRLPDGVYGSATADAVAAFQNTIWGREWAERHADDGIPYVDSCFVVDGTTVDEDIYQYFVDDSYEIFYNDLQLGDKGPDVGRIQNLLYMYNYLWREPDNAYDYFTQAAVIAFQKAHGLPATGVADEETQKRLASMDVTPCVKVSLPYRLVVDVDNQRVRAYAWDGEGYNSLVRDMICSTGKPETPTPVGIFTNTYPKNVWHYFGIWHCWAQYSHVIQGGVMFHSILYYNRVNPDTGENDHGGADQSSIAALGTRASHGCIRLQVEDARWLFNNCPRGTEVEVVQLIPDPALDAPVTTTGELP